MIKKSARVVLNRRAVDLVTLALADGVYSVGVEYIRQAVVPDAPPYGEGLIRTGGAIGFVDGKKIAGFGVDGRQPKKPRAFRPGKGIAVVAGWGFPARLVAFGTVKTRPHGWAQAALSNIVPKVPSIVRQASAYRIARIRA
jgi:hypothetical protein